jgi:heptosyltransferase-2
MEHIVVIRFGALGDLCLLGWSLARLAAAPGRADRHVTLVTKGRFADLGAHLTGVDEVVAMAEPGRLGDLVRLGRQLRRRPADVLLDAHGVLRSRLLGSVLGRRPAAVLRKDTAHRLRLLRGGAASAALDRHMRHRLDAVFTAAGLPLGDATPPLAALDPGEGRHAIGLAPGAQWDPKRWPDRHWADLARRLLAETDVPLRVFLGPREDAWWDDSALAGVLADHERVTLVRRRGLLDVAATLAGCRRVVCNDSGLMHVAEAVGTPVTAFFGPTVRAFGYAPSLDGSVLLETDDLDCRPCSRNGKRPCRRGDLACLERLEPTRAWATLTADRKDR